MKVVLALSVVVNIVLGFLYSQKSRLPPIERIVQEKIKSPAVVRTVIKEVPIPAPTPEPLELQKAYEVQREKIKSDKESFLLDELRMSPEELTRIEAIKEKYVQKTALVRPRSKIDLTINERRKYLDLEEAREQEFISVLGKAKFEKFQKFKREYNKKLFLENEEFGFVIPLDL